MLSTVPITVYLQEEDGRVGGSGAGGDVGAGTGVKAGAGDGSMLMCMSKNLESFSSCVKRATIIFSSSSSKSMGACLPLAECEVAMLPWSNVEESWSFRMIVGGSFLSVLLLRRGSVFPPSP